MPLSYTNKHGLGLGIRASLSLSTILDNIVPFPIYHNRPLPLRRPLPPHGRIRTSEIHQLGGGLVWRSPFTPSRSSPRHDSDRVIF